MKFISDLKDGDRVNSIYLCKYKKKALTKNGKPYENIELQDKTGVVSAKIWDMDSPGIDDFNEKDFVEISGDVLIFNSALQINIKRARLADDGSYNEKDFFPTSDNDENAMYTELMGYVNSIQNKYLKTLAYKYFRDDEEIVKEFKKHSAAKSVHHAYIGGLLEHTLGVVRMCNYLAENYKFLKRDLLIIGGLFHDIAKLKELTAFPSNDYTDEGQLIGHIVSGAMMLDKTIDNIDGFPKKLKLEVLHCILAHHGELEYGSPKKPAMAEALALNIADSADAKLEIMKELLNKNVNKNEDWLGFDKYLDSNIKRTTGV